jgi:hypothetical protein
MVGNVGNPEVGISPSSETPREQWRRNLSVNVWGKLTSEADTAAADCLTTGEVSVGLEPKLVAAWLFWEHSSIEKLGLPQWWDG